MNNQIEGVNLFIVFFFVFCFFFWGGGVVGERVTALTAFSFIFLLCYIFI